MIVSEPQLILGLMIGVFTLILLVLRTKIPVFLALIIAASLAGLIGGMKPSDVVDTITSGFGSTIGSIGIVIGFGVMIGRILEVSGAAERLAFSFLKWFGRRREEWALAIAGYIISIPIFVDTGFIILFSFVKALSAKTGKSVVGLSVALGIGLIAAHHAIPPTPGPLGVAGIFGADIGLMMLAGLLFGIPIFISGVLYAKWLGKRIYQLPDDASKLGWVRPKQFKSFQEYIDLQESKDLPSLLRSVLPIAVPIVLIFLNTTTAALNVDNWFSHYIAFVGSPVIAVGIGLTIAIYGLFNHLRRTEAIKHMEEGIASAGVILLVTGAGGALGNVLGESGAGAHIAQLVAATALPPILIPFVISSLVRIIQGSGTVAMITAASISVPIISGLDVNLVLAAQAAALGAMVFSYFNDSMFWVVNQMLGIRDVKEQILTWSVPTTIAWAVSLVFLLIANAIFG